jgi:hypothetical protein
MTTATMTANLTSIPFCWSNRNIVISVAANCCGCEIALLPKLASVSPFSFGCLHGSLWDVWEIPPPIKLVSSCACTTPIPDLSVKMSGWSRSADHFHAWDPSWILLENQQDQLNTRVGQPKPAIRNHQVVHWSGFFQTANHVSDEASLNGSCPVHSVAVAAVYLVMVAAVCSVVVAAVHCACSLSTGRHPV